MAHTMIEFEMKIRGRDVEIRAYDFEYSPDIGINGHCVIEATDAETGEEIELSEDEESDAITTACEIIEQPCDDDVI